MQLSACFYCITSSILLTELCTLKMSVSVIKVTLLHRSRVSKRQRYVWWARRSSWPGWRAVCCVLCFVYSPSLVAGDGPTTRRTEGNVAGCCILSYRYPIVKEHVLVIDHHLIMPSRLIRPRRSIFACRPLKYALYAQIGSLQELRP